MSDKIVQYFDAYYGTPVPASKMGVLRKPFVKMVNVIRTDIEDYLPSASEDAVKAGLIEALQYMSTTGKNDTPSLYINDVHVATKAFQYAIAAAEGKPLQRDRTPKEIAAALEREAKATQGALEGSRQEAEERAKDLETRDKITAALYREYHKAKNILIGNGRNKKEAQIQSYVGLLKMWEYQGGIDYYVMRIKIPMEEGIYDEKEVIDAQNAHYLFKGLHREGTRMMVNGKKWAGLS